MKNSTRILFILVLFLSAIAGYAADEKSKQPKLVTNDEVEAAWQRRVHDIHIDNFPLSEVAGFLSRQFPELNFIVPESARAETVPQLILRSVTLSEIFKGIELASEGRIRGGVPGAVGIDANTGLPFHRTQDRQTADNPGNIVTFSVGPLPGSQAADRKTHENSENLNRSLCRVFSLAPYLAYKSPQESEAAIQSLHEVLDSALTMLKKQVRHVSTPDLKIHPGTKLLIAVGGERELAVIEQIVSELQGPAPVRRITAPKESESKPKAGTTDSPAAGNKF